MMHSTIANYPNFSTNPQNQLDPQSIATYFAWPDYRNFSFESLPFKPVCEAAVLKGFHNEVVFDSNLPKQAF